MHHDDHNYVNFRIDLISSDKQIYLKALFNIVEDRFNFFLNFDVCIL